MRRVSYLIGLSQSIVLAIYAISLVIAASQVESTLGSPIAEAVIYLMFAALIYLVSRGFYQAKNWARTPYLVTQMFGVIIAYTLLAGDQLPYRLAGLIIGLSSAAGIIALAKTPMES